MKVRDITPEIQASHDFRFPSGKYRYSRYVPSPELPGIGYMERDTPGGGVRRVRVKPDRKITANRVLDL